MKSIDKPNILLIVVDALRSDHLSCYGYEKKTTPFLDDISTKSVVFENAISASAWTRPSFSSIFTGTYPSKNGHGLYPRKFPTIMQILNQYGYKTFGITDSHFVNPLCIGFDYFFYMTRRSVAKMIFSKYFKEFFKFVQYVIKQKPILQIESFPSSFLKNKMAIKWLDKNYDKGSFFMFLDYSVHWPYDPPKPFFSRFLEGISSKEVNSIKRDHYDLIASGFSSRQIEVLKSLYDGMISYVDSCLKELIDHIKSLDIFDNTLLIITSDHGDNIGEHGLLSHSFVLYEPLIKVPLIIKFPDVFQRGKRYSGLAQTIDIPPTLISYLDLDLANILMEMQGINLLKVIEGEEEREFTISERSDWSPDIYPNKMNYLNTKYPKYDWEKHAHEIVALRTKEYKYIWSSEGRHELYNLKNDPQENYNLISIINEKASELQIKLNRWKSSFIPADPYIAKQDLNKSLKKRLRALGYIE